MGYGPHELGVFMIKNFKRVMSWPEIFLVFAAYAFLFYWMAKHSTKPDPRAGYDYCCVDIRKPIDISVDLNKMFIS
jgi:hypothetical protein